MQLARLRLVGHMTVLAVGPGATTSDRLQICLARAAVLGWVCEGSCQPGLGFMCREGGS